MTVQDLITILRRELNDQQSIEFSDSELLDYINRAQRWLTDELAGLKSPYLMRQYSVTLTNNSAPLPSDFYVDVAFSDGTTIFSAVPPYQELHDKQYKIIGNTLYANTTQGVLYYICFLPDYVNLSDTITLHQQLINILIALSVLMAKNRVSVPAQLEPAQIQDMRRKLLNFALVSSVYERLAPYQIPHVRWK